MPPDQTDVVETVAQQLAADVRAGRIANVTADMIGQRLAAIDGRRVRHDFNTMVANIVKRVKELTR